MNAASPLDELRTDFLANSTLSMPIAGMIFWGVVAVASLRLTPNGLALLVLFGSGMVFPLGVFIDRLRTRTRERGMMYERPTSQRRTQVKRKEYFTPNPFR
jgi:hypothetical protein